MRNESDLINKFAARIANLPITNNKERREEQIRDYAVFLIQNVDAVKLEARQRRASKHKSPSGSLSKAAEYYHYSDREEWIAARVDRHTDQLQFVDMITPWYRNTMNFMPPMLRKVMDCVLSKYHNGIRPNEIARLCWKDQNNINSHLARLRSVDFVKSKPDPDDKRGSIYYVPDVNWLRVHALRWNRGGTWPGVNIPEEPREDIVDRCIAWFMSEAGGS